MPPKKNGRSCHMKAVNAEKKAKLAASSAAATRSDDDSDVDWAEEPADVGTAPALTSLSSLVPDSDGETSEPEMLDEERPGGRSARLSAADPWVAASNNAAKLRMRQMRYGTATPAASVRDYFASSTPAKAHASSSFMSTVSAPPTSGTGPKIGRPRKRDDDELSLDFLSPGPRSSTETYASHQGRRGTGFEAQGTKAARTEARARRSASLPSPPPLMPSPSPPPPGPPCRSDAGKQRGPHVVSNMPELMQMSLLHIAAERCFRRCDFVGGESMLAEEWAERKQAPWELRRAYAMAAYIQLHFRDGQPATVSEAAAARTVHSGRDAHPLTARALHNWLHDYVTNGGRLQPSLRGRHRKTESYLSDQDIKEAAVLWLRSNILASRKKSDTTTPLTVEHFCEHVNDVILKDIIADPASNRKKIGLETAREWMHLLGFSHCQHRKGIYVDGHERSDVVIDRGWRRG